MKVMITGANGFIGSHLINELAYFNLLSIARPNSNLQATDGVIYENITKDSNWLGSLHKVDTVIHLAGCAHGNFSKTDYEEINHLATANLVEQSAKYGVNRFIFLSTVLVNGEVGIFDYLADTSPQSFAAKTKLAAENEIKSVCAKFNMEFVIIRPPLVYGEGVKANFASLMNLVGKGLPLPFRWINKNKRSLVSVYNLCDLIQVCIEHPKAANQVFLASDDHDISTFEMVALMAKVQNKTNFSLPVPVWFYKLVGKVFSKEDVVDRLTGSLQVNIEHTKNTLDWKPPYSIEHGFKLAAKVDTKND